MVRYTSLAFSGYNHGMQGLIMQAYVDILSKTSLFKDIAESDLSGMLSCLDATTAEYQKREILLLRVINPGMWV